MIFVISVNFREKDKINDIFYSFLLNILISSMTYWCDLYQSISIKIYFIISQQISLNKGKCERTFRNICEMSVNKSKHKIFHRLYFSNYVRVGSKRMKLKWLLNGAYEMNHAIVNPIIHKAQRDNSTIFSRQLYQLCQLKKQ